MPLALGGLLLGLLAASIANHLDSRVYIAADVEQVLGFAPMAVLPDFDEVSDEVAAEHLLRLSASIEHARKLGNLKSCIFTGTAAGAGVTTVATRVRDILEAMGRQTVLLDASGTPPPAPRASGLNSASDQPASQRGSRSTALLQQVAAETEMSAGEPRAHGYRAADISAETEYLARFVDSAIVVIESGVTTRAQLLAAANTLQRLEVAAVGFVLNRVGLAKADPAFRHSVHDIEKHLRAQSLSTPRRSVRSGTFVDEPMPDPKELPSESAVGAHSAPAVPEPVSEPAPRRTFPVDPQWSVPAPAQPSLPQPLEPHQQPPLQPPLQSKDAEVPWWLLDAQPRPAAAFWEPLKPREPLRPAASTPDFQPQTPPVPLWEPASSGRDDFARETAPEKVLQLEQEDNPFEAESRLNGLRGLLFSLGLKNLGKTGESAPHGENSLLPLESEQERTVLARTFTPFAEPLPASAAPASADAEIAPAKQVTAEPEFLPPREFIPLKDREQGQETASTARNDRRDAYDDVQILPSRRGQYKKRS